MSLLELAQEKSEAADYHDATLMDNSQRDNDSPDETDAEALQMGLESWAHWMS